MKKDLIFNSEELNRFNCRKILGPSLEIFYSGKNIEAEMFLNRFENAASTRRIFHCTLSNTTEQVSSCILVEGELYFGTRKVPFFYLTQVITAEKFRGNGYFRELLGHVEEFVGSIGTSILIVIARRSVTDLYSKLDFKGFSHFPEFTRISLKKIPKFENYRLAGEEDMELLSNIYSKAAENIYGRVGRNLEDWKQIIEFQSKNIFEVFLPLDANLKCYAITRKGVVLEMAFSEMSKESEEFLERIVNNFDKVRIDKSDPAISHLSVEEWKYQERFESKEGHLIKIVSKVPSDLETFICEITNEQGIHRLNVTEVDQW